MERVRALIEEERAFQTKMLDDAKSAIGTPTGLAMILFKGSHWRASQENARFLEALLCRAIEHERNL